ncbi:amino acid adenylation domain-containing protein [Burkholderia ambifaria]
MTSFPTALHHRIRELARRAPDAPALAAPFQNDLRLSRGALDARASHLARQLRAAGVGAEVRVGVCVERSCELFVALLAVLKAGGVFVPLDPRHPAARLDWIVRDAQLRHGIVDAAGRAALGAPFEHAFDAMSAAGDGADAAAFADDEDVPVHPRAAAYMIYTSGSTGTPKAVVVEHGPLAAHCDALAAALPIEGGDRLLHFASVNFDAAHECWLAPLAVGASVTIAPPQPFAPDAAHALMVRESVSVAAFPPAYLREFAAHAARDGVPPALRVLAFGGEALPQQAFEFVRRTFPSVRLINGYGPTEAVISPMLWPVEPGDTPELAANDAYASLPIGRVIGPRVARIDGDEAGESGEGGELLLGGVCIARGYHGRPALTAERFIPDAHGEPGARVYRTGDLARLRADGAFDYLGRLDDQVQVRGVRVEPAEIAACLRTHPAVADAAVIAETGNGPTRLIACVALRAAADDAALKAHVGAQLPAAWQPHRFVRCAGLPYTLNGKIDRAALRERIAAARDTEQQAGDAPRTPTEAQIAGFWQTLLGLDATPSRDDRFFALGADSLAAMQLQAAIRAALRVNLRLDSLFADPTLAELAAHVDRAERETGEPLAAIAARRVPADLDVPHVDRAASLAQQRFWVLAQTRDASAAYHIAAHWTIDGALDRAALQRALDHVIERHDAWRTTLVDNDDGIVMQRIHAHLPVAITTLDLREQPPAARDAEAARIAERDAGAPFDLSRGPLLRATLVVLADERHRLLLTAHPRDYRRLELALRIRRAVGRVPRIRTRPRAVVARTADPVRRLRGLAARHARRRRRRASARLLARRIARRAGPARAAGRPPAGRDAHAAGRTRVGPPARRGGGRRAVSCARRAGHGLHGAAGRARRMAVAPDRRDGRGRRGAGRASSAPGDARAARPVPEYGRAARARGADAAVPRAGRRGTHGGTRRGRAPGRAVRARRRCGEAARQARRRMAAREIRAAVRCAARQRAAGRDRGGDAGPRSRRALRFRAGLHRRREWDRTRRRLRDRLHRRRYRARMARQLCGAARVRRT